MKIKLFSKRGLRGRRWYFRIIAGNGEPIAQSEGYANRTDAIATAHLIKFGAASAEVCSDA